VDTGEIEVFLALAEELHFGRTAERLRMPQPRVSRMIVALERRTGGALFERTSRRVRLTPLGEQLHSRLRPIYTEFTAALDEAREAARGVGGVLRVGFTVATPGEPLTRLVQAFEARHRECRATLVEHPTGGDDWDIWRPLRCGESDVLVYWQATGDEPDLTAGPVLTWTERVLLVGRGHRLAGRESVPAEELASERVDERPNSLPKSIYDLILPPRTPSGRMIPRAEPLRSYQELMFQVASGRIVHPSSAGLMLGRRDDIVAVPLTGLPAMPLGLTWCTAHENARIRALAAIAASLGAGG
jgi:DNA-binding transcriptional LysR family regulator